jgi:hypothetical protein
MGNERLGGRNMTTVDEAKGPDLIYESLKG